MRTTAVPVEALTEPLDEYTTVRAKHLGRWASAALVLALAFLVLKSVVTNPRFGWETVGTYIRDVSIVNGIAVTLLLTVGTQFLAKRKAEQ